MGENERLMIPPSRRTCERYQPSSGLKDTSRGAERQSQISSRTVRSRRDVSRMSSIRRLTRPWCRSSGKPSFAEGWVWALPEAGPREEDFGEEF